MLRRLSVRHLFLLVPLAAMVALAGRDITDNSFLWHVRAGTLQLDTGEVIRNDPFSFTALGEPWRTQSWLADLLYGWLENLTGDLAWVWPMMAIVLVGAVVVTAVSVYAVNPDPRAMAIVIFFVSWLSLRTMVPRPVIFAHLALALLVLLLHTRSSRWAIPLVMWAWAGLHGSYVIGLGLILLEALRTRDEQLPRQLVLSVVTTSLTAHGIALWGVLARFLQNTEALDLIQEWAPPDLTNIGNAPYLLILFAILVAAIRGQIGLRDLFVVLPFLIFGMTSNRAVFPATLVLAPWAVRAIVFSPVEPRREMTAINWALAIVIVVGGVAVGASRAADSPDPEQFPVAAIAQLGEGRTFVGDLAGGYFIYAAWPERLVYIDDRAELFGVEGFEEMLDIRGARSGWDEALNARGIDQALLRSGETGLEEVMRLSGWSESYADDDYVILRRP